MRKSLIILSCIVGLAVVGTVIPHSPIEFSVLCRNECVYGEEARSSMIHLENYPVSEREAVLEEYMKNTKLSINISI